MSSDDFVLNSEMLAISKLLVTENISFTSFIFNLKLVQNNIRYFAKKSNNFIEGNSDQPTFL